MHIVLTSALRNAEEYVSRYFAQFAGLRNLLAARGDRLDLIIADGDHADGTRAHLGCCVQDYLNQYDPAEADMVILLTVDHGGPDHGSVVNAERFANMAKVWNVIWRNLPSGVDAVLFVEADLVWSPETLIVLLDRLADYPAIAPMIHLQRLPWGRGAFYDTWAYRKDGSHIKMFPPYFPGWDMREPIQIDSGGSCLAIRGELARQLHWPAEDVVVGVCKQIYAQGGSVWLDPGLSVTHL